MGSSLHCPCLPDLPRRSAAGNDEGSSSPPKDKPRSRSQPQPDRRHHPHRHSIIRKRSSNNTTSSSSKGMGQNLPKQRLPRTEVRSLQRMISFDEAEIQDWYQEFLESVDASSQRCCKRTSNSSSSSSSSSSSKKYLTRDVFVGMYDTVFPGRCEAFASHVFRTFDRNSDRKLDFREFLLGLSFSGSSNLQKKLCWAFQLYDVDRSGFISLDNMTSIVRAVFQMIGPHALLYNNVSITAESLAEEMFTQMDLDGDQKVSWAEFQEGVTRNPIAVQLLQLTPPDLVDLGNKEKGDDKKPAFEGLEDSKKCLYGSYN